MAHTLLHRCSDGLRAGVRACAERAAVLWRSKAARTGFPLLPLHSSHRRRFSSSPPFALPLPFCAAGRSFAPTQLPRARKIANPWSRELWPRAAASPLRTSCNEHARITASRRKAASGRLSRPVEGVGGTLRASTVWHPVIRRQCQFPGLHQVSLRWAITGNSIMTLCADFTFRFQLT